jgi:Na+/proline symporter
MSEQLTPFAIIGLIGAYFLVLILVSYFTGRRANQADFFIAGRQSPWLLVAIGMIGASLSGVTFISVPGQVGQEGVNTAFSYLQIVFGYLLGYLVIATVLMPIYYKHNLVSIYGYLGNRIGIKAYRTGAGYFLLSRTIGAAFRLYLVAMVLQPLVMEPLGVPFWVTVSVTILLIWIYTFNGGIKTIVWTDTLQTICMLAAVIFALIAISKAMDLDLWGLVEQVRSSSYDQVFFFEEGWSDPNNFFKQFLSGALLAIVMTGLDQDMMQKNLSCRTLGDAQKNMFVFSIILVFANLLFLTLGAVLYIYADYTGMPPMEESDQLFPTIALGENMPAYVGILFLLGLIAAAYSSADSALTSLTTSFSIDFLEIEKRDWSPQQSKRNRLLVHLGFSVLLVFVILIFRNLSDQSVINQLFTISAYTYGPLLGMFSFGILTKRKVKDIAVPTICADAVLISYIVNTESAEWFNGFEFGFLILAFNGLLTFVLLWIFSKPAGVATN